MNAFESFYLRPAKNELIETVVQLKADPRPALIGSVVDETSRPVANALVAVYESGGDAPDKPIGSLYTDELGQFAFGPLEPSKLYIVRVYKGGGCLRTLEHPGPEAI